MAAWRGRRRVHGQGRAPEAALGVPLGEVWPNAGSSEAVRSESCGKFSDSVQLFAPGRCPMLLPHFPRKADYKKGYRSVPARAHRIPSFVRLVIYSRIGLRFASHGFRIRIARDPALLAFSSAVGWISGVRFDGEPPRVSVCISSLMVALTTCLVLCYILSSKSVFLF